MPATKATPFRFTPDELAAMDGLVKLRGCKSRVALLRALVAEEADRPGTLRVVGGSPTQATSSAVVPVHVAGARSPKDCSHPITRRIGSGCAECGADPVKR